MPLLKKDVERIKALDFDYDYFVIAKDGWLQLKNNNGKCVFNNGRRCIIYEHRPEGCRLYPIIFDEDEKCATLDEDCHHRDELKVSKDDILKLTSLIRKLDIEKEDRGSR
jgi:Fe-S-cluster containining protein